MSAAFYPYQKISFNRFVVCSTLILTACGGGGGGGGDSATPTPVVNTPPTNVAFIIPLTPTTTELVVSWQTASDDKTPVAQLEYTLHLLEGNTDFTPSPSTQKFKAKNSTSTKITGLKAQTSYQLKLVVTDSDGLSTTSHVSFTTQSLPNAAPANVALKLPLQVTSFTITPTWDKATDDTTPQAELSYSVHLVEGKNDFAPSTDNQRFTGVNVTTAALTGLKSNTDYALKLLVKDKQGLTTASSLFTVKTLGLSASSIGKLNDTGIVACANDNTWFSDCSKSNLGGLWGLSQDGEIGRDYLFATQQITKVGGGAGGFDFTKISATGSQLAANASNWSCVQDNTTALMWEVKTTSGTHDKNKTYAWYNPNILTNGGDMGVPKAGSNTFEFINIVNGEGLCGHKDWRLPTRQELDSIIDYGSTSNPKIDTVYFPHIQALTYWTATPMASSKFNAWAVNFADGADVADMYKGLENYVILVRTVMP